MKIPFLKLLPAVVVLGLSLALATFAPPARAVAGVGDTVFVLGCLVAPGVPCASSADVAATTSAVVGVNTQLTTTHTYLATGVGGGPGGVVSLLGGINERLGMVTNANNQSVENDDLAARQRIYDERMMDVRGSRIPKPSSILRACVQATTASGRAGAARTSGGAARSAGAAVASRYDDARPQIQAKIDVVATRADLGTCSATDVSEKRPGCHATGAGDRPSADLHPSSLFDGGKTKDPTNISLDERGFKIGQQFIVNVAPMKAQTLPNQSQRESQGGIIYMIDYNRYTSRATAATDALADVLGFGVAMGEAGSGVSDAAAAGFLKSWASNQAEYEKMFGAGSFPAKPSERELLRFAVFKHYASVQNDQEQAAMSEEDATRTQIELAAINARVNYEILARLEKQNVLLSALLAQQMDPLTSGQMDSTFKSLGGASKTGN